LKPVLFVSHEPSVTPGIAADVFAESGIPLRVLRAWEETAWPEVNAVSGVVVLGGDMSANDVGAFPFLERVGNFVSEAVKEQIPTLGICLGAQILALVLGGSVRRSPRVELGFGALEATKEGQNDQVLAGFSDDVPVFQWHEDTFDLPPDATLLLTGGGFDQAFRYGERVYGTQFHFEVTHADIAAWIETTPKERLESYWGRSRDELLAEAAVRLPGQQEAGRDAFRRFAKLLES
jgi:GMP synthase (glutamine-hydrolysing)